MVAISMQFMENVQLEELLMLICDGMERLEMSRLRIANTSYKDCYHLSSRSLREMRNEDRDSLGEECTDTLDLQVVFLIVRRSSDHKISVIVCTCLELLNFSIFARSIQ